MKWSMPDLGAGELQRGVSLRPLLRTLRAGDTRGRLFALWWSTRVALDVAVKGAAIRSGLLQELKRPTGVDELIANRNWPDASLVEAALRLGQPARWCRS